jgi:hypothetical protein
MDLIGQLTQQLGIPQDAAQGAAGALFQLIGQQAPQGPFQQLMGQTPEAQGWMAKAQALAGGSAGGAPGGAAAGAGGGLGGMLGGMLGGGGGGGGMGGGGGLGGGMGGGLGGMLGAAAGMLGGAGGSAGQVAALAGILGRFGISPELAVKVVPLVLMFIQSKLGAGGTQQLAAGVPLLQHFLTQGSNPGGSGGGSPGEGGGLGGMLGKLF